MNILELINISKTFGDTEALIDISFNVKKGEIISILGPSGCGKSTILMIIAGLEKPDHGDVLWERESILKVPPHLRGFGLMFQDYALFPHMNVEENIAFGLKFDNLGKLAIQNRIKEILTTVNLIDFEKRDINTLSGGEGQRVALARSLAPNPKLLMLDEPLRSVDRSLREHLLAEIRNIIQELHLNALYVTHDQEEAFAISDRIVLVRKGQVEQIGTPQQIYRHPGSLFAAKFLGFTNLMEGVIIDANHQRSIRTPIGDFPTEQELSGRVMVLVRPDGVSLDASNDYQLSGTVVETSFRGTICRAVIAVKNKFNKDDLFFSFDFPNNVPVPESGEHILFSFDPKNAIQLFQNNEISPES